MPFTGDIKERLLALEQEHGDRDIFVIGGVEVLETARPVLDRIYVTHIRGVYRSDTRMYVKEFLAGFTPVRAHVSRDCQSTFVVYDNIFKRRSSIE
jgi:dihydrofolate reductase